MSIKNGDKVKIISLEGESFLVPSVGTILTVRDASATNFTPPKPAPYCVDSKGNGVWVLLENLERVSQEPTKQASGMRSATTLDIIKTFTMNHKDIEISFEDGMITVRDWDVRLNQPMDYHCDTIEQLEELMGAWEKLCKFKS